MTQRGVAAERPGSHRAVAWAIEATPVTRATHAKLGYTRGSRTRAAAARGAPGTNVGRTTSRGRVGNLRCDRRAPKPDLVPVRVSVRRLPDAVWVRPSLRDRDSTGGNFCGQRVKVIDEDGVHHMPGVLGLLHDVQEPVVGKLPHRLRGVRQEARLRSEEALVPPQGFVEVAHRNAREQVARVPTTLPGAHAHPGICRLRCRDSPRAIRCCRYSGRSRATDPADDPGRGRRGSRTPLLPSDHSSSSGRTVYSAP